MKKGTVFSDFQWSTKTVPFFLTHLIYSSFPSA
jgi:hypothetical protein